MPDDDLFGDAWNPEPTRTAPRPPAQEDDGPPSPPIPPYATIADTTRHAHTNPLLDGPRDGDTYEPDLDADRLNAQHARVAAALAGGAWWTLANLAAQTGAPQASVSARLRDLRKPRFGSRVIERRRVGAGRAGTYEYRMDPDKRAEPPTPDPSLGHAVIVRATRDDTPPDGVLGLSLCCQHCPWRYRLHDGSTVQELTDALARHP